MNRAGRTFGWSRSSGSVLCTVSLLATMVTLPCGAQTSNGGQFPSGSGQSTNQHGMRPASPTDMDQPLAGNAGNPVFLERRMQQLNAVQHKAMVADTEKLLKLVTELNAEINRTNTSSLTAEQLRKVAEIEKLAHSVKDKMRTSVRSAPDFEDSSPLPPVTHR